MDMNVVILSGRLGKDPEIRYSKEGKSIATFSVAIKGYGGKTDWIPCVAFGKTAETIEKYFHRGSRIEIEGAWATGSYESKTGGKVYTHTCQVAKVHFVDSKSESGFSETPPMPNVDTATSGGFDDFMNFSPSETDELPFK